jgi:PKHD-type hydroxylase
MFPVNRFSKPLNYFCVVNDVFNEEEIEKIIALEDLMQFTKGQVGESHHGQLNTNTRDSDIMWVHPNEQSIWLFEKFSFLVGHVNYDHFMYDIEGFDAFQYTRYKEQEHYTWHYDSFGGYQNFDRKISASILLTDPKDYEGGEFEIILGGNVNNPVVAKPKKGDVIFFASWMPHRVAPVTSGVRKSLVCWILGKRFS